nr:MAG TPA: hypothetical protein [Caudoviricetes sp.]
MKRTVKRGNNMLLLRNCLLWFNFYTRQKSI